MNMDQKKSELSKDSLPAGLLEEPQGLPTERAAGEEVRSASPEGTGEQPETPNGAQIEAGPEPGKSASGEKHDLSARQAEGPAPSAQAAVAGSEGGMSKAEALKRTRAALFKREAKRYAFMLLGCILYASSFHAFLTPHKIVAGGVSGLASIFYLTLGWPVGLMNILINIPILILGLKVKGWAFILRCLITTVCLGIFTDLFAVLPSITDNALLAAMYGGILQGLGIGLFIKYEVSSGGTELLGRISQHFLPVGSIPFHVAFWDGLVVLAGSIVMKNPENILYALIIIFISARLSDLVVTGLNKAKLCYIITERSEELSAFLLTHSPRGVTLLEGKGMYTRQPKGVLLTCVKTNQLSFLRTAVKEIDPQAFVIVSDANEVYGKGFYQM